MSTVTADRDPPALGATPPPSRSVACGACTLCCRRQIVVLFPQWGDDVDSYAKMPGTLDGEAVWALPFKPGTDECHYLTDKGCSIHARRPVICRAYSCLRLYLDTPRAARRRRASVEPDFKALMARGRELAEGGV